MRAIGVLLMIVLSFSRCSNERPAQSESLASDTESMPGGDGKFKTIFDGKSFAGWEGNPEVFRIEDAVIIGGWLDKKVPHNEFLCTEKQYRNFELRLKAKMVGEDILNGGIQFRSKRIPDHHEVIGYQCDMGEGPNGNIWGHLYDESRRQKFLDQPAESDMLAVYKPDDWNEFVIGADGNHIQIWLNGFKTVDYTEKDEDIAESGSVCLQIHGGFPAEAWYKDLKIKTW